MGLCNRIVSKGAMGNGRTRMELSSVCSNMCKIRRLNRLGANKISRFVIVKPVEALSKAVLHRLGITDENIKCMMFSSQTAAQKCIALLEASPAFSEYPYVEAVRFFMPSESNEGKSEVHWANFSAVILPSQLWKTAMSFWRDTGSGLSSRNAEYCLTELDYLDLDATDPKLRVPAPKKRNPRQTPHPLGGIDAPSTNVKQLKTFLAQLATSEQPGQPHVSKDDVFLYPNGMNAIWSFSETISSLNANSTIVAFG